MSNTEKENDFPGAAHPEPVVVREAHHDRERGLVTQENTDAAPPTELPPRGCENCGATLLGEHPIKVTARVAGNP